MGLQPISTQPPASNLQGATIVFTGTRDKQLIERVKNAGVRITNAISRKTTMLVSGGEGPETGKGNKARELGIPILTIAEFKQRYGF